LIDDENTFVVAVKIRSPFFITHYGYGEEPLNIGQNKALEPLLEEVIKQAMKNFVRYFDCFSGSYEYTPASFFKKRLFFAPKGYTFALAFAESAFF